MSRFISAVSLAALVVAMIPFRVYSTPTPIAQKQSSEFEQSRHNTKDSSIQNSTTSRAMPKNSETSTVIRDQDQKLLPPIDTEFGLKATFGKCSAVEVIGPDGTCIPMPIPN